MYRVCAKCIDVAMRHGLPVAVALQILHPFLHGTPLDAELLVPLLMNQANENKPA